MTTITAWQLLSHPEQSCSAIHPELRLRPFMCRHTGKHVAPALHGTVRSAWLAEALTLSLAAAAAGTAASMAGAAGAAEAVVAVVEGAAHQRATCQSRSFSALLQGPHHAEQVLAAKGSILYVPRTKHEDKHSHSAYPDGGWPLLGGDELGLGGGAPCNRPSGCEIKDEFCCKTAA